MRIFSKQQLELAHQFLIFSCLDEWQVREADHIASVGQNRKLLIFPIEQLQQLSRGRGNFLQRFAQGCIADAKAFKLSDGLSWKAGQRTRNEVDLNKWLGKRAQAGSKVPRGFSTTGKFG